MSLNIKYSFQNNALLEEALTHPSLSKKKDVVSYERLEFLGDNVINLIVAKAVFERFPTLQEGKLSQIHANLVRSETLSLIAKDISLDSAIKLDSGEESNNGRGNQSILENALEALVGAIFLDSNFDKAEEIMLPLLHPYIDNSDYIFARDAKSILQEWAQKHHKTLPIYTLDSESGLAHQKEFCISVRIEGIENIGHGIGSARKRAEVSAAENLITSLGITSDGNRN